MERRSRGESHLFMCHLRHTSTSPKVEWRRSGGEGGPTWRDARLPARHQPPGLTCRSAPELLGHRVDDLLLRGEGEPLLLHHRLAVHRHLEAAGRAVLQLRLQLELLLQRNRRTGGPRPVASSIAVGDGDLRVGHDGPPSRQGAPGARLSRRDNAAPARSPIHQLERLLSRPLDRAPAPHPGAARAALPRGPVHPAACCRAGRRSSPTGAESAPPSP